MKRFNIDAPTNDQYTESPDGEWVRYEDARAEVERLRAEQNKARGELLHWCREVAAANALLAEHQHKATVYYTNEGCDLAHRTDAHLAAQPATAAATRPKVPGEFESWQVGDRVQLRGPLVSAYAAGRASVAAPSPGLNSLPPVVDLRGLHVARTEAEQRVLDAMCGPTESAWSGYDVIGHDCAELLNAAIVARRGLK